MSENKEKNGQMTTDVIRLTIDGHPIEAPTGASVLDAALGADIYVPHLCAHPYLPAWHGQAAGEAVYRGDGPIRGAAAGPLPEDEEGCRLCLVEIEGQDGLMRACATEVAAGMAVRTDTPALKTQRQENLASIMANHPHACLTCAQREGCSRTQCSTNVPENERCCALLGHCELQKVVDCVGILDRTPRWVPTDMPVLRDEPLFERDYNLCIGCTRCVRACREVRGIEALHFVVDDGGQVVVGSVASSLRDSGCKFCTACVEVCPTGALTDKDVKAAEREAALVPCRAHCPAGADVPRYVRLVAQGKPAEATAVVRERVPFPAVLGNVCFHPCEDACRRGEVNEPIAICALKRYAAERDNGLWKECARPPTPSGKRMAIVGSGPAGLTAAYFLARRGHAVTVYESQPEAGGMMRYGMPEYRLPPEVLHSDVAAIVEQGVEIKTNTPIGDDDGPSLADLRREHDAVFVAVGSQLSRKLNVEGLEQDGVLWGMDFLRAVRQGQRPTVGRRVLVIGGGNVAVDVALTARRLGGQEVQMACLESRKEMPAFEWEIQQAQEEIVAIHTSWGPKRILGNDGQVAGLELVRCTSVFDEAGRFSPRFDEGTTTTIEADTVIMAIGQASDLSFLGDGNGLRTTRGDAIVADADSLETGAPGLFAGGEVVSGPASAIESMEWGRKAAMAIDRYLGGAGDIEETLLPAEPPNPWLGRDEGFADWPRTPMPCRPVHERAASFAQIELGFDEDLAVKEAQRCLQCDLRLDIPPVVLPPEEWLPFSAECVAAVPETEGVFQLLDAEKNVLAITGAMNLRQALEEKLESSEAVYFVYEEDTMYTKRESELLQQYLQQHGALPGGGEDELDDLF